LLLERLKNSQSESDYFRWLLFVVGFYRGIQKVDAATALLRHFIETSSSDEQKAHCHLTLGQIATDEQHFEAALKHFKTALALNPQQKKIVYVLHNNAAYCLNMLHCYAEGNDIAVGTEVNWTRAGYRNLGVSLKGQAKIVEALGVGRAAKDVSDERARLCSGAYREKSTLSSSVRGPWKGYANAISEYTSKLKLIIILRLARQTLVYDPARSAAVENMTPFIPRFD
jgi:tetratricopeptide (TPR) repeat protein